MQTRQIKLWLAGFLIIAASLFAGTVMGGTAGYIVAKDQLTEAETVAMNSADVVPPQVQEQTVANPPPAVPDTQSLVITEQSAIVDAVKEVLPAVVTVISAGNEGTGSGSGFFINNEGYLVTNNHVVENADRLIEITAAAGILAGVKTNVPEYRREGDT